MFLLSVVTLCGSIRSVSVIQLFIRLCSSPKVHNVSNNPTCFIVQRVGGGAQSMAHWVWNSYLYHYLVTPSEAYHEDPTYGVVRRLNEMIDRNRFWYNLSGKWKIAHHYYYFCYRNFKMEDLQIWYKINQIAYLTQLGSPNGQNYEFRMWCYERQHPLLGWHYVYLYKIWHNKYINSIYNKYNLYYVGCPRQEADTRGWCWWKLQVWASCTACGW